MKKTNQQGFTLIELMIVVAIIGILAAVALPAYQNYTIKAKVGSAISQLASLKTEVALCYQETGGLDDCDTGSNGIQAFTATKELASATVTDGVITATFQDSGIGTGVDTFAFTVEAKPAGGNLQWLVDANTVTQDAAVELLEKNNAVVAAAASGG